MRVHIDEAKEIALAVEVQATRLIIDERLGRQAASSLGIKVTGVLGILLVAKRQKLIADVKPVMDDLINQANFRISQKLYAKVLDAANE